MQDFTGVPAVVDLAAMRDAMADLGGDANKINPLVPAELVIDHSVQVDVFGTRDAFRVNVDREYERNEERYAFLRWGQGAFEGFKVVPPGTGIVHQVNLEYLARVVFDNEGTLYPDTLVGTDSHTTMINGLGVLGWGVGGIEAEAAMLGQPMSMLIPRVVGFKLGGELPEGATATDLVLTVTQMLREHGVVGKFVEFYGPGVPNLPLADRATIGNMSPEFGVDRARSSRSTRRRCATWSSPAATTSGSRSSRRTRASRACGTTRRRRADLLARRSSSTSAQVVPSLAGPQAPAGPRDADRVQGVVPDGARRLPARVRPGRRAGEESFPASDPPASTRARRPPRRRTAAPAASRSPTACRSGAGHAGRRHRDRARPRRTSSSPRSRRAPTPPTRR